MGAVPDEIGIMVLSGSYFFPESILPLQIFEPRYKEMLQHAVENNKMFAISPQPLHENHLNEHAVGCIGIIRECKTTKSGHYLVWLHGVSRVRFTKITQILPYLRCEVSPLFCEDEHSEKVESRISRILDLSEVINHFTHHLPPEYITNFRTFDDYDLLIDMVTSAYVRNQDTLQVLIESDDLAERALTLLRALEKEYVYFSPKDSSSS
jgi:Lon protease-like protein